MPQLPHRDRPLKKLGFLHVVPFDPAHPAAGLRDAVELFAWAEELGFDAGFVRTRHLQHALPSPLVLLAAIAQATARIELGTAVIPVEFENPFRLAEDLAVLDHLSGGRVRPGLSAHPPRLPAQLADRVHGRGWSQQAQGHARIEELLGLLRGEPLRAIDAYQGFGGDLDAATVQPLSPGLVDRVAYGAGSLASATWAGASGLRLLVSNISSAERGITAFDDAQAAQMRAFRAAHPAGEGAHVSQARVVVPLEGTTPEQERRYRSWVEARTPRTRGIVGEKTIIAPDTLGTLEDIVEAYAKDPGFALADEVIIELPFEWEPEDWRHVLEQVATRVGPALGWVPRA